MRLAGAACSPLFEPCLSGMLLEWTSKALGTCSPSVFLCPYAAGHSQDSGMYTHHEYPNSQQLR